MYRLIPCLLIFCFFLFRNYEATAQQDQPAPNFLEGSVAPGPQYQVLQAKIGFNLGWTYPYSAGVEFSVLFLELFDVNAGVGMGMSGWKYGGGMRFYPIRASKFSPLVGMYLYHATGLRDLSVSTEYEMATFNITPDTAVLLNGGARMRFGHGNYLTMSMGYVFPFVGDKAVRVSGSNSPELQDLANAFATSGFSLSFGILIKISKGNYELNKPAKDVFFLTE